MRIVDLVRKLCANAKPVYLAAFEKCENDFLKYGVNSTKRVAHFLAQTCHESGAFTIFVENGNYSAKRITQVWPSRFKTVEAAEPFANNPEKLFNSVYANRMGNGGPETGDGFRYRGHGPMQTTGRAAYAKYGNLIGVDLLDNPDLLFDEKYILLPALAEWKQSGCNELADKDDIQAITKRINGGLIGFDERKAWLSKVKAVIGNADISFDGSNEAPQPQQPAVTVLKLGSTGDEVTALQKALGITVDGKFGRATEAYVQAYQAKNKLVADGIVGAQTGKLLGLPYWG